MLINKPESMDVHEWLVKSLSMRDNIPVTIIEQVVRHQNTEARSALKGNNSLEFSGFGKFLFNQKKAERYYDKFHMQLEHYGKILEEGRDTLPDIKKKALERRLDQLRNNIVVLGKKLEENRNKKDKK